MDAMQFHVPVRLSVNGDVHEIDSVRQAAEFLGDWPAPRRGPVFACALNVCHAAAAGTMRPEDARKAFESFARITGILVPAGRLPSAAIAASVPHLRPAH